MVCGVSEAVAGGIRRLVIRKIVMRMAWYIYVAAFIWLLGAPSLMGQEFLKQLEQKLFQKQQESKSKESKLEPEATPTLEFPNVLTPELLTDPELAKPKSASELSEDAVELPAPIKSKSDGPVPSPFPAKPAPTKLAPTKPGPTKLVPAKPSPAKPFPSPASKPATSKPFPANPVTPTAEGGGFLGLTVESVPGGGFGLTVVEVTADSPAWKSGFRVGDRVISVSGHAVATVDAFANQLAKFEAGSPVKFQVDRRGKIANLVAVLQDRSIAGQIQGNLPGTALGTTVDPSANGLSNMANRTAKPFFGVNVSDMSDGFRRQFAIPAYRGASVTNVIPFSPAHSAGLKPGDCIVDIDGAPVQSAETVLDAVQRGKPGQVMSVSYYRGRLLTTASVPLAIDHESPSYQASAASVTPEMLTPEYVASLQSELERVNSELTQTQSRLQQLESRMQSLEGKR
jgi:membrane-associated protease RseP (regulator of RpoE activity)